MKVILIKNVLHNGDRVLAGQEIELSDSMAKRLIETGAAKAVKPVEAAKTTDEQPEQPAKKSGGKKGK